MAKSVPAIFLDRDGTINVDHGYVHEIDEFEFIDGVIDASSFGVPHFTYRRAAQVDDRAPPQQSAETGKFANSS